MTAYAQSSSQEELEQARTLFAEGVQLEAGGDWAGALNKFQSVARVKMTPQVRFHIARCHHHLGNLLEALGGYRWAAHEASSDPQASEVLTEAREAIAQLEKQIPKLTIRRAKGGELVTISLDGATLGEATLAKEIPVNPGSHTIVARTPDGRVERKDVRLKEAESQSVEMALTSLGPASSAGQDTSSAVNSSSDTARPSSSPWPWITLGAGGVSLLASGAFYMLRAGAKSDMEDSCAGSVCPSSMRDTADRGRTYTTLGNVTLGLGIVGVGVGSVWLLTRSAPSAAQSSGSAPKMTVIVGAGDRGGQASLVGSF